MAESFDLVALRATFAGRLLAGDADTAPFLTDWRGRWTGRARCVIQPDTADDVARVVRWCADRRIAIVPQGGNTGLSGGSVPDESGQSVVLSLARLNRIRSLDTYNSTMVAEAGCILHDVQKAAFGAGRLFPLSLAAEGSCTIGGNLATNAGGTAVLRYGNARELCLGLEVVTPDGAIWDGLNALRKNNSGYDLRDLFIGSEGTLGVITAAVLKLHALPKGQAVAFVAVAGISQATDLLELARNALDARLTAFELLSGACLRLVACFHPATQPPVDRQSPWYVLIEVSDTRSYESAEAGLNELLQDAFARGIVTDGVVAGSLLQAESLWAVRENVSESQGRLGPTIKHDIALPISRLADFVSSTGEAIASQWPDAQLFIFGHLGDGNLHYNLSPADGSNHAAFAAAEPAINRLVHDAVDDAGGSISAEHGLGVLRRDEAGCYKSPVELRLMHAIKRALDPDGLMNPGKVLAHQSG
jgi:FAD/FMN-containing dehydrogenase